MGEVFERDKKVDWFDSECAVQLKNEEGHDFEDTGPG
jgi:hypothetical protein